MSIGNSTVIFQAYSCLFCSRLKEDVFHLVTTGPAGICDECVDVAAAIVADERKKYSDLHKHDNVEELTAVKIKQLLDETIIGQDNAKKILSVAAINHLKRINEQFETYPETLPKNNLLILGPTGSGKTFLIQQLAKILDVPVAIGDATRITMSGYIGDKIDDLFYQLIKNANGNKSKAEYGIVYLDEIDKLASSSDRENDTGGRRVQEELLRAMEGCEINATRWEGNHKNTHELKTDNILFIFGGAFVGLDEILSKRLTQTGIGFSSPISSSHNKLVYQDKMKALTNEDLIKFGFIPEFLGRISTFAVLNPLTEDDLYNILASSQDSVVQQYTSLFKIDNIDLQILPNALKMIAREALKKGIGARGLKSEFEKLLLDHMFSLSESKNTTEIIIDSDETSDKPQFQTYRR